MIYLFVGKSLQLRFTKCITESIKWPSLFLVKASATLMIDFEMMQKPRKIVSSLRLFLSYYTPSPLLPSYDIEIFPFYIVRPSTSSLLSLVIVTRNVPELASVRHFSHGAYSTCGSRQFCDLSQRRVLNYTLMG